MDIHPPTDAELHSLQPHILLTSNAVWDPSCLLDDELSCDELGLVDAPFNPTALDLGPPVTDYGEYTAGNLQVEIDLIWLIHQPDSASRAFKEITEQLGPLNPSDRHYNDSSYYSVLPVHWEDGAETFEPLLSAMAKEDPITCAKYDKDNDLLLQDGNHSSKLLLALPNLLGCVNRPSSIPKDVGLSTSLVSSLQMITSRLSRLIRTTATGSGSFPLVLKWTKSMNITPFTIWGEV
jgi:hypothetical protein